MIKKIKTISLVVLTAVILLCFAEIFLGLLIGIKRQIQTGVRSPFPTLRSNAFSLEYVPWVQFRSPDEKGAHRNVAGFERKSRPELNREAGAANRSVYDIYFFGGSTMQGVNVSDEETLSSHFAGILGQKNIKTGVRVHNFGQPYYNCKQEVFLFFSMIAEGKRPNAVVFLDGLNEGIQPGSSFYGYPFYTPIITERMRSRNRPSFGVLLRTWLRNTNIYGLLKANGFIRKTRPDQEQTLAAHSYLMPSGVSEDEVARTITSNYIESIKAAQALAASLNIKCYFFWQPVPFYRYDRSHDPVCDKRQFPQIGRAHV